jgi:hypothetical protein
MKIKNPVLLPDHIKKMIDPSQRQKLGIATEEEREKKIEAFNERKLHQDIRQLLNLKGIVFFEQRMDKRSRGPKGWPDFTFAVWIALIRSTHPVAICWECKAGKGELSPDQEDMAHRIQKGPNAWRFRIIRSLQEAADELKALGI